MDLLDWCGWRVVTTGIGECCSLGAMLLAFGHHRRGAPNLSIMTHEFMWGTEGHSSQLLAFDRGRQQEHKRQIKFWLRCSKYKTEKQLRGAFLREGVDHYMTPKEALSHGIIDEIITN